jgi:hypothetical protein
VSEGASVGRRSDLPHASRRLWRLRKLHHVVDAELTALASDGFELRYAYDGELSSCRVWPTREQALDDAAARRAELEREGWMFRW